MSHRPFPSLRDLLLFGSELEWTTATTLTILGPFSMASIEKPLKFLNASGGAAFTIDLTTVGAGGIASGSGTGSGAKANSEYHAWVIGTAAGKNLAALADLKASGATLPPGFAKSRRVGSFMTSVSGVAFRFRQYDEGRSRKYVYEEDADIDLQVLNKQSETAYTDVDLSRLVPQTAVTCNLHLIVDGKPADFRPKGLLSRHGAPVETFRRVSEVGADSIAPIDNSFPIKNGNQTLQFKVDGAAGDASVVVYGYTELI